MATGAAMLAMLGFGLFAPGPAVAACGIPMDCDALARLSGAWTFAMSDAGWRAEVDDEGKVFAEATRSFSNGGDQATYRARLAGTITQRTVTLQVTADNFSNPNFVPGPPTICTGALMEPDRYAGFCANQQSRTGFVFTRNK